MVSYLYEQIFDKKTNSRGCQLTTLGEGLYYTVYRAFTKTSYKTFGTAVTLLIPRIIIFRDSLYLLYSMFRKLQIIYILIFSVVCLVNGININVIPEYLNDKHFAHVEQCEIPCEYFENHESPDAELYIAMNDDDVQSAVNRNSKVPIRILGSNEAQHYYPLLKLDYLKQHFQGSALMNRKSDIPWVTMADMDITKDVSIPKDAQPKATFVARNCNPMINRNDYGKAIDAKIGVVAPSICLNNAEWPDRNGTPCSKVEALRQYKIHLAFENGDSPGYISEKIYNAFEAGVLPVWLGTRDIAEAVPKGSYIDVAEFNTPDDVANYLKIVLENETLYNSYFEWKKKPFDPEYVRNNRVLWSESVFCRICHYVDTLQRGLEWDHVRQRAKSPDGENIMETDLINEHIDSANKLVYLGVGVNEKTHSYIGLSLTEHPTTMLILVLITISFLVLLIFRRKLFSKPL